MDTLGRLTRRDEFKLGASYVWQHGRNPEPQIYRCYSASSTGILFTFESKRHQARGMICFTRWRNCFKQVID